ncbi:MAG: RNA ligase (ATP), partial [Clostridia bacterium]|nr:RNA ligase (ATP) [Clostridia bacterium]
MRKLASIQRIDDLHDIKDADFLSVAKVQGWNIVVNKNDNFKVGDKIVMVEIDSILPPAPEFEFLKDRKYRVRTIKL